MVGNCVAPSRFRRQCAGPRVGQRQPAVEFAQGEHGFGGHRVGRPGCGWQRARGIRTPCYLGQIASPAICGQDGSRARTEDHPAGLWEVGHGGRRRRRSASRGGLRRGGAGGLPRTRPLAIVRWGGGYRATPDADPIYLYTDDVIGILPKRNLNNGQPSLHAALIAAAAPQPGGPARRELPCSRICAGT